MGFVGEKGSREPADFLTAGKEGKKRKEGTVCNLFPL